MRYTASNIKNHDQVCTMAENYKISKEIGLRILELRNDGLTFPKIAAQINAEFEVELARSSVERFYKNFLKGSSRILPKDIMNVQIKPSQQVKKRESVKTPEPNECNTSTDFSDSGLYDQLTSNNDFNQVKKPRDEILNIFMKKPIIK